MSEADSGGEDWDAAGLLLSSTYRVVVMRYLTGGPAIPSTIAEETDLQIAHVSRALQRLRDEGLVELLVEEDTKKGRIYGTTEAGERALAAAEEVSDR